MGSIRNVNNLISKPGGKKTASALVHTGPCLWTALIIRTDGTNDATVTVYDGTSDSGDEVAEFKVKGDELSGGVVWGKLSIEMEDGIYMTLAGTGAYFYPFYSV